MYELHETIATKGGVGKSRIAAEAIIVPRLKDKDLVIIDADSCNADLYQMTENYGAKYIFQQVQITTNKKEDFIIKMMELESAKVGIYQQGYCDLRYGYDIVSDNGASGSIDKLKFLFINGRALDFLKNNYTIYIDIVASATSIDSVSRDLIFVKEFIDYFKKASKNASTEKSINYGKIKVNIWKNEFFGTRFNYFSDGKLYELEDFQGFKALVNEKILHAVYTIRRFDNPDMRDLESEAIKYKKLYIDMAKVTDPYVHDVERDLYNTMSNIIVGCVNNPVLYDC